MFGREKDMEILIEDPDNKGINDVQKESYESYLKDLKEYESKVPDVLLSYFLANFEEIDRIVSLTDDAQKDTIVAERIFKMFMILSLYIDREGNYGWICKFSWEKNGLAILLSESEPRIITPDQLRNLHKINDNSLGLLVHDGKNAWVGLEQNDFFGKDEDLRIELEGSVEEGITPAQQQAYEQYLVKKEDYFNEFSRMMLSIYTGSDEQADNMMSMGHKIMVQTALPKILFIDKEGNYGWICYTQWDDSYIGVLLSEKKQYFLSTNNLHHYSEVEKEIDNELGLLFPTYLGFESAIVVRLMDNVLTLPLVINARPENVIDEDIRKAYKTYLRLRPTFWNDIKGEMLFYYQSYYKNFENYLDIPEELNQENVNEDNVISILEFTELFIRGGRIAWLCESPTEEDGLAFEFTDGKVEWNYQNQVI
ncbi:MAG: hypothetical protein IK131_08010 [Paludibacteraceae bacterium]|nr:hypothetical protein [Paludibacteraceae bacterium]